MSIKESIEYMLNAKIRPFYYTHLSRQIKAKNFDDFLSLFFSGQINPDIQSIEKKAGNFILVKEEKESYLNILKEHYPNTLKNALAEADLVISHVFDFLGSGPVNLGPDIDWHCDFKSGHCWGTKFYKEIASISGNNASDIKVPWELSRFHHFCTLGRAYWISGDEKYAKEFVNQLLDWIKANPPRIGVNWYFSMEVAIRIMNWISAYFFFRDSPFFNKAAKIAFFRNLLIHQIYIYHNLEFGYRLKNAGKIKNKNGNHYFTNLIGLIMPSIIFPSLSIKLLRKKALRWLYNEIISQVNPDGVHNELSVGYHRLISELLLTVLIVMKNNKKTVPNLLLAKTEKMLEFVAAYTKPDGTAPLVRDCDDGRILSFTKVFVNDHRYLLNIGAVLFNRPDFKAVNPNFSEEALWWIGPIGLNKFNNLPCVGIENKSISFPNSGFYFMKKNDDYLKILCAGVGGAGCGGHGHNDALSFELFTAGRSVFVDPGTYVYSADSEMRNLFRSTAYHNTVCIDRKEINNFVQNNLFSLPEEAHPIVDKWSTRGNCDIFVGRHSGYKKLPGSVVHHRIIFFNKRKKYWKITDYVSGKGSHHVEIFYHLGQGLTPEKDTKNDAVLIRDKTNIMFSLSKKKSSPWNLKFKRGWVSPSYGIKNTSWIISYSVRLYLPLKITFVLKPFSSIK